MHTQLQRVVVTGYGLLTPVGHNVADTWAAILTGRSGFGPITDFDKEGHVSGGICAVKDLDPADYMDKREVRRRDRFEQFTAIVAREAMDQSGLPITSSNQDRIGVFMGTGIGGINTLIVQQETLREKGPRRINPFAVTMIMPNGAAGMLSIDYGIQGPSMTVSTACASGVDAIGQAFRALRSGELDAALTGGVETSLVPVALAGFDRTGATSSRTVGTPSPFDKNRDGLIMGEGAGILVIETLAHARARGATILGEIVGYGQTTDAYHITAPAEGGLGAARAMTRALADAGLAPAAVDYVSAHGTGTPLNDLAETQAIKAALGPAAQNVAISSTKSMTGHIMGATGAIESVFCLLAIRDQIMPPTINLNTPDPDCDLDYVPNEARPARVDVAMNNAFGFGGHNGVLVFKKYEADEPGLTDRSPA